MTRLQKPAPAAITYVFPVGNYPVTDEVLLAWGSGISRSFVPAALSTPGALVLFVLAGWAGLRALSVPRGVSALALAAVASAPLPVEQVTGPNTDLPALAWLACTAALCAGSVRRPALVAPAVVAAGLAVGTKTTALPLAGARTPARRPARAPGAARPPSPAGHGGRGGTRGWRYLVPAKPPGPRLPLVALHRRTVGGSGAPLPAVPARVLPATAASDAERPAGGLRGKPRGVRRGLRSGVRGSPGRSPTHGLGSRRGGRAGAAGMGERAVYGDRRRPAAESPCR